MAIIAAVFAVITLVTIALAAAEAVRNSLANERAVNAKLSYWEKIRAAR